MQNPHITIANIKLMQLLQKMILLVFLYWFVNLITSVYYYFVQFALFDLMTFGPMFSTALLSKYLNLRRAGLSTFVCVKFTVNSFSHHYVSKQEKEILAPCARIHPCCKIRLLLKNQTQGTHTVEERSQGMHTGENQALWISRFSLHFRQSFRFQYSKVLYVPPEDTDYPFQPNPAYSTKVLHTSDIVCFCSRRALPPSCLHVAIQAKAGSWCLSSTHRWRSLSSPTKKEKLSEFETKVEPKSVGSKGGGVLQFVTFVFTQRGVFGCQIE